MLILRVWTGRNQLREVNNIECKQKMFSGRDMFSPSVKLPPYLTLPLDIQTNKPNVSPLLHCGDVSQQQSATLEPLWLPRCVYITYLLTGARCLSWKSSLLWAAGCFQTSQKLCSNSPQLFDWGLMELSLGHSNIVYMVLYKNSLLHLAAVFLLHFQYKHL